MSADELDTSVPDDPARDGLVGFGLQGVLDEPPAHTQPLPGVLVEDDGVHRAKALKVPLSDAEEDSERLVFGLVISGLDLLQALQGHFLVESSDVDELLSAEEHLLLRLSDDLGLVSLTKKFQADVLVLCGGDAANHKNDLAHGRLPLYSVEVLRILHHKNIYILP